MPLSVNPALIEASVFRSDALGPLDFIAHPLEAGHYRGIAYRGDLALGTFEIAVSRGGEGSQVDVNLAGIGRGEGPQRFACGVPDEQPPVVLFHAGGRAGGFRVTLQPGAEGATAFDSRRLGKGDLYIFIPVLPGDYALVCDGKLAAEGRLTVTEAEPGEVPSPSGHGGTLVLGGDGFDPRKLQIIAGDGAVVRVDHDGVVLRAQMRTPPDGRGISLDLPLRYRGPREVTLQRPRPLRFPKR